MTALETLAAFERDVQEKCPGIPWREPIPVRVPGVASGLGCRICIACRGLQGRDVGKLPQSREEFDRHMATEHPIA